eukprot:evm.model.scf_105.3 EVM.evm.TU.scf_105.3   scf_105:49798-53982(+)
MTVCMCVCVQSVDGACKASEKAAVKLEIAAEELEQAAIVFEEDLPPTLKALEHASREFEDLGQSLNMLSGGFSSRRSTKRRRKRRPSTGKDKGENLGEGQQDSEPDTKEGLMVTSTIDLEAMEAEGQAAMEAITKQTMNGIAKVAADLNNMTQAMMPTMDEWRVRLLKSLLQADRKANSESVAPQAAATENGSQKATTEASSKRIPDTSLEPSSSTLSWISGWQGKAREPDYPTGELEDEPAGASLEKAAERLSDVVDLQPVASTTTESEELEDTAAEDTLQEEDELQDRREAAMEVLDALLRAERAAQDAANASGDLQQAVRAAQKSGAFDDIDADFSGDSDALPTVMAASPHDQDFYSGDETHPLERGMDEDAVGSFDDAKVEH